MNLYLDECIQAAPLVQLLQQASHDVLTPLLAGTLGIADDLHLQRATVEGRAFVTKDAGDFFTLHKKNSQHAGILAVHQDNDPTKDMTYGDIVRAIANLLQAGVAIKGQYWILNSWKY